MKKMIVLEFDDKYEEELRSVIEAFCKEKSEAIDIKKDEEVDPALIDYLIRRDAVSDFVDAENRLHKEFQDKIDFSNPFAD